MLAEQTVKAATATRIPLPGSILCSPILVK